MAGQRWVSKIIVLAVLLLLIALVLPFIQMSREAARRSTSKNRMKQIGIALDSYHETHSCLPPGGTITNDGKAMHGWLALLLPFFDASPDYNRLDFEESWESPANLRVFQKTLPKFMVPDREDQYTSSGYGVTHYLANPHLLHRNSHVNYEQMRGGATYTWSAGVVAGNYQPWSYPFNWRPLGTKMCSGPDSYGQFSWFGGILLFADGSVSDFSEDTSPAILKQLAAAPPVPTSEQMIVPNKHFETGNFHWDKVQLELGPENKKGYYARVLRNSSWKINQIKVFSEIDFTKYLEEELLRSKSFPFPQFLFRIDSTTDIATALNATTLTKESTPEQFQVNVKTLQTLQRKLQ